MYLRISAALYSCSKRQSLVYDILLCRKTMLGAQVERNLQLYKTTTALVR